MSNEKKDDVKPGDFEVETLGRCYSLPAFAVKKDEGLVPAKWNLKIAFVRGSKDPEEKITETEGITHESLLEMQIADIQHKNKLVSSEENEIVIKKLKEALMWLDDRKQRREREGKLGTYKE